MTLWGKAIVKPSSAGVEYLVVLVVDFDDNPSGGINQLSSDTVKTPVNRLDLPPLSFPQRSAQKDEKRVSNRIETHPDSIDVAFGTRRPAGGEAIFPFLDTVLTLTSLTVAMSDTVNGIVQVGRSSGHPLAAGKQRALPILTTLQRTADKDRTERRDAFVRYVRLLGYPEIIAVFLLPPLPRG